MKALRMNWLSLLTLGLYLNGKFAADQRQIARFTANRTANRKSTVIATTNFR